jgi:hypothetical protein
MIVMKPIVLIVLLGMWAALSGCYRTSSGDEQTAEDDSEDSTEGGEPDGDADGDTDGDADADSDMDADVDTDCTDVTPCGGDVVGTWRVTASCLAVTGELNTESAGPYCTAPITGTLEVTGTWTANVDGTYTDRTITTGTVQFNLMYMCKEFDGSCISCATFGGFFKSFGYTEATCEDEPNPAVTGYCGGGCNCTAIVEKAGGLGVISNTTINGNYTIDGSTLTISEIWPEQAYSYCVSESALTMTPVSTDWSGTVTGAIELRRQ